MLQLQAEDTSKANRKTPSRWINSVQSKMTIIPLLCCLWLRGWKKKSKSQFVYLMDINVRTRFSLSVLFALGVLFSLFSSSRTASSTWSMLSRSFFCGVRASDSSCSGNLDMSRKIFGTLLPNGVRSFTPTDFGDFTAEAEAEAGSEGSETKRSEAGSVFPIRWPSTSPSLALLLSIALALTKNARKNIKRLNQKVKETKKRRCV